jgi:maltose alpha-D-glucosyltransferase/alpha-amylase
MLDAGGLRQENTTATWYKEAVIYQLHVKSFFDANNDGVGDFHGLMQKLDYLADLGVTALWLLPFYPSPRRDDGYDIADYRGVHPEYGKIEDVRRFIDEAHKRNLKVITELVVNHTSDQHPWFQRARHAPKDSPERAFYVWSDDDKAYAGTRIIFIDTEKSNWTWDDTAKAYYWHRFYSHQPDLNFDNPAVLDEVLSVMRYWFDMGVDGLRLDAVPYLVEREGTNNENLPETHAILKRIRAEVDAHYSDRMLLAEANQWPEDVQQYFGDGDECHMLFHFPLMPRMYMALAQEDRFPINDIMRQTPDAPPNCQWAIFLRNHDELTLEMVTDKERDYLWQTYAADKRARLNLGIRRRLAPLLQRDRRRIELMNALLMTMPGTPIIYYGDEIGMGDNIHLGDRDGVRTPMQWSPDRNGGFSRSDPADLVLPAIQDPLYGYESVNVEAQARDTHSLLNWLRRMLSVRRRHRAFGRGALHILRPQNRKVLAYLRSYEDESLLCVANVSGSAQAVELDLSAFSGRTPVELSGGQPFPRIGQLTYLLSLPPYGFYWFLLSNEASPPPWSTVPAEPGQEYYTFVLRDGLSDVLKGASASVLTNEILPAYVAARRWFQDKDNGMPHVAVAAATALSPDLLFAEIETRSGEKTERYTLPLSAAWDDETPAPFEAALALARIRKFRLIGFLTDGFASTAFAPTLLRAMADNASIPFGDGEILFSSHDAAFIGELASAHLEWLSAEQTNSTVVIGQKAVMKLFRRLNTGIHPEIEMTEYLHEQGYGAVAELLASAKRRMSDGEAALAVVQRFIANQGDAFQWTVNALARIVAENSAQPAAQVRPEKTPDAGAGFRNYENFAAQLGRRVGEMHRALASNTDNPAFKPERAAARTVAAWTEGLHRQLALASDILSRNQGYPFADSEKAQLQAAVTRVFEQAANTLLTRIHGDLHLGQVLVAAEDVVIVDFEGEPLKSLDERRAKNSPLRDVAGILRSFDYAIRVTARRADVHEARAQAEAFDRLSLRFRDAAEKAFLAGYEEGRAKRLSGEEVELLLAFQLEKCAYEIAYEAKNRPDWLDVPAASLKSLSERLMRLAS